MTSTDRFISGYKMGITLGKGGFSKVKLGWSSSGDRVALKILKKSAVSTSASINKQVQREVGAMSKISHQNVIKLYHVDTDAIYPKKNGTTIPVILVVLELAEGGELFEMLAFSGSFEETIARSYFHQLMAGLYHCHSNGIAHRDLKPENLLMDSQFQLKIADFGFSNAFSTASTSSSSSSLMHTECGTPGYMAPEMFRRGVGYDAAAADIWACGVVLFIMIAGFPPFQRPVMSDWWFSKLASNKHHLFWEAHSRSAYFSDDLKDLVNKILSVDPAKRISLIDISQHQWFTGQTVESHVLTTEMTNRKLKVDEQKRRQKGESTQQNGGFDNMGVERSLGDSEEGVDSESDSLPPQQPSFQVDLRLPAKDEEDTAPSVGRITSSNFASSSSSSSSSSSKPALVYDQTRPSVLTKFTTSLSSRSTLDRLLGSLDKLNAQYSVKDEEYKVKISLSGGVEFNAQVFRSNDKDEESSIVEFRKKAGDSTAFRKIYAAVRADLEDIIVFSS